MTYYGYWPMKIKINIKTKLIFSLLAIVLITGVASIVIGIKIINDNIINQAYDDVQAGPEHHKIHS